MPVELNCGGLLLRLDSWKSIFCNESVLVWGGVDCHFSSLKVNRGKARMFLEL